MSDPHRATTPAAPLIARLYHTLTGTDLPIGLRAWDGSQAGPADRPILELHSPRALRRLLWSPNEVGLAQAYVTGEIDLDGDVAEGLRQVWASMALGAHRPRASTLTTAVRTLVGAARLGAIGVRPAAPASQAWQQNLETNWTKAVGLVGLETARVWRLYVASGALAFEQGRIGVDQILAAKPAAIRPSVAAHRGTFDVEH